MSKPWSKLKSRVKELWVPGLPMAIHTTSYTYSTKHDTFDVPRHWIVLDKETIWDFPHKFIGDNPSPRGAAIAYYDKVYGVHDNTPKPIEPAAHNRVYGMKESSSIIAIILRHYLDRPRDALFEPFPDDQWELTDLLRAADSRIGKAKLLAWAKTLDDEHAALAILKSRLK